MTLANPPSRVVVLGAGGFIGRRIVAALRSHDAFKPVAASRHATSLVWKDGIEALDVDAALPEELGAAIDGADAVVNCIAGKPSLILAAAQQLLGAAAAMPHRPCIVNIGSLAAYGSATGLVKESSELLGDLDGYSAARARSDRLAAQYDFAVTLRAGIVYGPGSPWWSDRIARLLIAGRLGDLGPRGTGICNLIYVDDVAAAVVGVLRMKARPQSAFNLSSSGALTWNEYFSRYAAALSALPVRRISSGRLTLETSIMSPPLKLLELALRKPEWARWNPLPPVRPWLPRLCARNLQLDATLAETMLGMKWTALDSGLALTADWFRSGGRTALPLQ